MMIRKTVWLAGIVLAIAVLTGCKKETPPAVQTNEPVKTAEEFKAEADKQITAENLDTELDKLEQEVETDMATEP